MELHSGMIFEPPLVLLVRVEIIQDDVKLAARKGCDDFIHEAEELDAAASL